MRKVSKSKQHTVTQIQNNLLERTLRGTTLTLTAEQARTRLEYPNLDMVARMADFRKAGLRVHETKVAGQIHYSVSRRDRYGLQDRKFMLSTK